MLDGGFDLIQLLRIGVDITLVWYVLYKLIMLIRGTKAIQLLKGIAVVLAVWLLSIVLDLQTVRWITSQVMNWGLIVIIILFQPELRRALEQLGRGNIFGRSARSEEEIMEKNIDAIIQSCNYMAKRRIGALITIERETGIGDYAETGIPINGKLTHQLLTNIFTPNTPLHDGAVILKGDQIIAAACYLPLSESPFISKELGTRHRAAMGISEVTDALTIVVSEETGDISCTKNGELHRELSQEGLRDLLHKNLSLSLKAPEKKSKKWRGNKNG
ncbi:MULTISPECIES: diadenylate cyclase CdaA [Clostridia]|uniref:diadenylate cyclase CdaA n=1 Tax=Clostridia TaxID=186801 RepID=UPI000EA30E4B|nr:MULTISPECIES: diadenylate cyclase CdaA [Clostridia]NBJ70602.1 TIGR00159 family protein [Roseburia sp. 1XD42-34]RKI76602.1 TIGR00159 family protein [Clostridium sp. 1xD42-85]